MNQFNDPMRDTEDSLNLIALVGRLREKHGNAALIASDPEMEDALTRTDLTMLLALSADVLLLVTAKVHMLGVP